MRTVCWDCIGMRFRIKIQYQLTPFVLRCARCACSLVSVGCDFDCVAFAMRFSISVRNRRVRVCVAACDINTPMRSIVNLRCVARRWQFVWTVYLSACVLFVRRCCMAKLCVSSLGKPIQFCRIKLNCLALLCVESNLCARRRQTFTAARVRFCACCCRCCVRNAFLCCSASITVWRNFVARVTPLCCMLC